MISEFRGEYNWLSNFTSVPIILDGIEYQSVEHAYMSEKSNDKKWKEFCSNKCNSASLIKKESKKITLIDNWKNIKIDVMYTCLTQKFNQEPFKTKLINTGKQIIQEGNHWKDEFWGVNLKTGKGKNELGKLIMDIRKTLITYKIF